jgi:hypothetical protein
MCGAFRFFFDNNEFEISASQYLTGYTAAVNDDMLDIWCIKSFPSSTNHFSHTGSSRR